MLLQSRSPAVDVRIYYANWMTVRLLESLFTLKKAMFRGYCHIIYQHTQACLLQPCNLGMRILFLEY